MDLSPVTLAPAIKDYIWGGNRLITEYNKHTDLDRAAESWELSTHKDGPSIVSSGKYTGCAFSEYISENAGCTGKDAEQFDFFPILIKLIDAKNNLSIQVHPNDEYALKNEGEYGKTEMWYVVDCTDNAFLYYGLNKDVSRDEFLECIKNNTVLTLLNKVPVHRGDVFFIPAGTIHAICSGILICEIQQNSNTTYRVYDYNRLGTDGKPRELHIKKAADVSVLHPTPAYTPPDKDTLASCKYFTVKHLACVKKLLLNTCEDSFQSLIIIGGSGSLTLGDTVLNIRKGDSVFIPAQKGICTLAGDFEFILSYV